jgi:hypothetical protein
MHVVCVSIVLPFDLAPLLSGAFFLTTGITIAASMTNDEAIRLYPKYTPPTTTAAPAVAKAITGRSPTTSGSSGSIPNILSPKTTAAAPMKPRTTPIMRSLTFD